ncbi:hypothetical protein LJB81_01805 [Desulfovibrio sp. OttesenSCG-928-M14]|nr:hypothetical protein [Desulfovibrio sp. OttesenSCG-928-M14]
MQRNILILLIVLLSLFLAYRRKQSGETGYAVAWLCCALVNGWLLFHLLTNPDVP